MIIRRAVFLCVALVLSGPCLAQTLEKESAAVIRRTEDRGFFTLNVENDLFGGGTDRNYTSGVRLTYFDMGIKLPPLAKEIDRAVPTFRLNETTSVHYSIGQNLYTPKDIRVESQPVNDRPWAAFLYGSAGLTSITDNHIDTVEATLGVIGPLALGKQTQRFIHGHLSDSPDPRGWRNQLKNEPAVMLGWERRWPDQRRFRTLGLKGSFSPHAGVTLGNVYTFANAGLSLSLGPDSGLQDGPVRVRPAMPGTGAFIVAPKTASWYLFSGLEGRAVARNIFLDGNTFTDSHSVDKKPLVYDATAGLALTYDRYRVSYALVYRSPEFDAQDNGDVFGTVTFGLRF